VAVLNKKGGILSKKWQPFKKWQKSGMGVQRVENATENEIPFRKKFDRHFFA
jgi:hypothetical protein